MSEYQSLPRKNNSLPDNTFQQNNKKAPKNYRSTGNAYTWQKTWQLILTKPSEESFEEILGDPQAEIKRALTWAFIVGIISSFATIIRLLIYGQTSPLFNTDIGSAKSFGNFTISPFTFTIDPFDDNILNMLTGLVFGLIIGSAIIHIFAKLFGGQGKFRDLVYARASYEAPLSMFAILGSLIPVIGIFIFVFFGFYKFVLEIIAVKTVYRLGWFKAIASIYTLVVLVIGFVFSLSLLLIIVDYLNK